MQRRSAAWRGCRRRFGKATRGALFVLGDAALTLASIGVRDLLVDGRRARLDHRRDLDHHAARRVGAAAVVRRRLVDRAAIANRGHTAERPCDAGGEPGLRPFCRFPKLASASTPMHASSVCLKLRGEGASAWLVAASAFRLHRTILDTPPSNLRRSSRHQCSVPDGRYSTNIRSQSGRQTAHFRGSLHFSRGKSCRFCCERDYSDNAAIFYVSVSLRFSGWRYREGFRMPAGRVLSRGACRPASENLRWRKPRVG